MPRIALHPAPAQEEQKILAVAAALEFFNSLLSLISSAKKAKSIGRRRPIDFVWI